MLAYKCGVIGVGGDGGGNGKYGEDGGGGEQRNHEQKQTRHAVS